MITLYQCINFDNYIVASEPINQGDAIKVEIVDDVLEEICLMSDLNIEQLEELD